MGRLGRGRGGDRRPGSRGRRRRSRGRRRSSSRSGRWPGWSASSDRAPGPAGAPGVYVSPLTNSTPSLGTKTRIVVLAWLVGSASTVTGRTGSGSVIDPVAGTARMFACVWLRSRRSRSSREERFANTSSKNGTAAAWTTGRAPTRDERPHAARVVGVVVAAGHVADRLVRERAPHVVEQRLAARVVERALDDDDPVLLLDDHRLVGDALDQRVPRRDQRAGRSASAVPSLMKPRWAKVISHSVVRAPRLASERVVGRPRTPDGKREAVRVDGRSPRTRERVSRVQDLAALLQRHRAREGTRRRRHGASRGSRRRCARHRGCSCGRWSSGG